MTSKTLTRSDLAQFTGSEIWYRHGLVRNVHYTQGVRHVAETGGAYWLIDKIAFSQAGAAVHAEAFQHWTLEVKPDQTAHLSCTDGNDKVVYGEDLEYTDFPLDKINFYFTDTVLLLPSEY